MPESGNAGPETDDQGVQVQVRLRPDDLAALDGWIDRQDPKPTRPAAIQSLVELALRFSNPGIGLKEAEDLISDLRSRARYPQPPDAPMFRAARKLKAEYEAAHSGGTSGSPQGRKRSVAEPKN